MVKTTITPKQIQISRYLRKRLQFIHRICNMLQNIVRVPGNNALVKIISHWFLPPIEEKSIVVPTIYGFYLCVSKRTGRQYYYYGYYEPGTIYVMQQSLEPGDVFIDAGASVGLMTFMASILVGNDGLVLSFEPHPYRYLQLKDGISINKRGNISAYNLGLGKEEAVVRLYTDVASPSMVSGQGRSEFINVHVEPLDTVLRREKISNVRMIKIDVEGFEGEVLQGAEKLLVSEKAPILCIEHGVYESNFDAIGYLQKINDYSLFQLKRTKMYVSKLCPIENHHELRLHDNVFCFLPYHLEKLSSTMFL